MVAVGVLIGVRNDWELAFETFVRSVSPGLLRTAVLLTGDRGAGEDLLQLTLLRVARNYQVADPFPTAYARRILVNLSKDRLRARSRRLAEVQHEAPEVVTDDPVDQLLLRHELTAAVGALPDRQRTLLILRFFTDLSVDEAANAMGCSPGTVKSQTHKALKNLRTMLRLNEEEQPCPSLTSN